MTEEGKKKSGNGKFIFGAALGAIAGAVAGHFISKKMHEDDDECGCNECDCDHEGPCGDDCPCDESCPCKNRGAAKDSEEKKTNKKE